MSEDQAMAEERNDRNLATQRNVTAGFQTLWPVPFLVLPGLLFSTLLMTPLSAQETEQYFQQNCTSCHTIGGGDTIGPDLANVSERAEREWLVEFIVNPEEVIDSGDPYAQKLVEAAGGVIMPPGPAMTPERAHALLDFIERESGREDSTFGQSEVSERPLTADDVEQGRSLFLGRAPLENGGAACMGCHDVNGDDSLLGGGLLGPNLTAVSARLGGRQGLSAWLSAPPTPTMQAVFQKSPLTPEEILPLVAYFQYQAETNPPARTAPFVNFLLFGLGGTVILLVMFDLLWRSRFRAVRRPLVQRVRRKVHSQIDLEDKRALYE